MAIGLTQLCFGVSQQQITSTAASPQIPIFNPSGTHLLVVAVRLKHHKMCATIPCRRRLQGGHLFVCDHAISVLLSCYYRAPVPDQAGCKRCIHNYTDTFI